MKDVVLWWQFGYHFSSKPRIPQSTCTHRGTKLHEEVHDLNKSYAFCIDSARFSCRSVSRSLENTQQGFCNRFTRIFSNNTFERLFWYNGNTEIITLHTIEYYKQMFALWSFPSNYESINAVEFVAPGLQIKGHKSIGFHRLTHSRLHKLTKNVTL